MQFEDRVRAVAQFGFTDRQARFLATVMLHSGVCLLRHYATFAGIVEGQKTRKFFVKLVRFRYASAYLCRHNRGRVYQVHHKGLYRAIGETDSPHRRPLSPARVVERLMLLDALLADRDVKWLVTAEEKAAGLTALSGIAVERLPHVTGEPGSKQCQLFPERRPIGIDSAGRVVLLYLATESVSYRFSAFLQRHFELLHSLPSWTLKIVVPTSLERLGPMYVETANDDLTARLRPDTLDELRWYFEQRRRASQSQGTTEQNRFDLAARAFDSPRYRVLYGRWLSDGDSVFNLVSSGGLSDDLMRGAGRIESTVLQHEYRHLTPLVGATVRKTKGAEEGERVLTSPRPLPSFATHVEISARTSRFDESLACGEAAAR